MKKPIRTIPVLVALFFAINVTPAHAGVPLRVVIKSERLGKPFAPDNPLYETLHPNYRTGLAAMAGFVAYGCTGLLTDLAPGWSAVLGSIGAGTAAYAERGFSRARRVMLGPSEIAERPEFEKNLEYVPLLRHLLRGGELIEKPTGLIIRKPELHLRGVFTVLEFPSEIESQDEEEQAAARKPKTRVEFAELSAADVAVEEKGVTRRIPFEILNLMPK